LRNGLALVRDSARLHAALGVAYLQYREAGIDFGEGPLLEAEACARKVFELEPASAGGFQLRGWIHYSRGRIQEAVRDLKLALELEPNDPDTVLLLSNCYLISGRVSSARPLLDRLISIDPLTPLTRCMPAFASLLDGDVAGAIGPYREMFEMDPGNPMARLFYVWVLLLNRRTDAAANVLESFPVDVRDTVPARIAFFLAAAFSENGGDGQLPPITPDMEAAASATDVFARLLADAYALAGVSALSIRWIEVAIARGFINYPFLSRWDPCLENVRSDSRFVALMEVVRKRWERFES